MAHLTQALLGWLMIIGLVFGGIGAFFFVIFALRSLILLARRIRIAPPEKMAEIRIEAHEAGGR